MTTITYEDWKNNECVLLHELEIPEARDSRAGELRLGVAIRPETLFVRIESTVEADDIYEGLTLSRLREQSEFGKSSAHYILREVETLKAAIAECESLKGAFELLINRRIAKDREAFELSLQGQ